ncbi:hypothetical protein Tco_1392602, partial [Tanacetum coccineum]
MALPPREQRHRFLRYKGLEYSDADIVNFEARFARIYRKEVHRVQVFDFGGLPDLMAEGLSADIPDKGDLRDYWIGISSAGDFLGTSPSYTMIRDPILRLYHRLIACSIARRSQALEKAWVSMGLERQPDAAAGAPAIAEDAPAADEGDQAVPAPVQVPQQPPPPPPTVARTIPQRLGRLEEDVQGLRRDVGSLRGLVER